MIVITTLQLAGAIYAGISLVMFAVAFLGRMNTKGPAQKLRTRSLIVAAVLWPLVLVAMAARK